VAPYLLAALTRTFMSPRFGRVAGARISEVAH
jgi:hypothetical protein